MNALQKEESNNKGFLLLRITIGVLILFHGIANMNSGYAFIKELLDGYGIPSLLAYGVFVGEIIAPILMIIGYKAKLSSLTVAFNFLIAILLAHGADIFSLNQFGGWGIELQALYLLGSVTIFFLGAGKYAVSTTSKWD